MISKLFNQRALWISIGLGLALPISAVEKPIQIKPVTPGLADGRISTVTATMLEQIHYLKQPVDNAVSIKLYDHYLESLDPQHIHFIQADLDEFAHYRTNLDNLLHPPNNVADTRPACEIFNRFMERLQQRAAYAEEMLKTEKFRFDGDDRITINRKDSPYPQDLNEAKALWRERLRFEYL